MTAFACARSICGSASRTELIAGPRGTLGVPSGTATCPAATCTVPLFSVRISTTAMGCRSMIVSHMPNHVRASDPGQSGARPRPLSELSPCEEGLLIQVQRELYREPVNMRDG